MLQALFLIFVIKLITSTDVIIVGGGVSGVTAGNILASKGYNVTLLEGRSRRGGRVWSDNSTFGYYFDFGAAWIHGKTNNSVYNLATSQNANLFSFNFDDTSYFSSSISDLSSAYNNYYNAGSNFNSYYNSIRKNYATNEDHPLSDLFNQYLQTSLTNDEKTYVSNYVYVDIEGDYGTKMEDLSAVWFDQTNEKDKFNYLLPNGYWNLFDSLINFPYLLNSKVVAIDQTGSKVSVTLSNQQVYKADYVIVTVPLGVLKNNVITFSPPLSSNKQNAINKLGFGSLEKLVVEFSSAFWSNTSILKIMNYPIDVLGYIVNLNKVIGKNTLVFLIAGDGKYWNSFYSSIKSVIEQKVITLLSTYYTNASIVITNIAWTNWKNDPFSFGSYSHFAPGSNPSMVDEFLNNEGKIYFAGEHTNKSFIQTVQGAYESGKAVASKIPALTNSSYYYYLSITLLALITVLIL